jgi:hypothetical protein
LLMPSFAHFQRKESFASLVLLPKP